MAFDVLIESPFCLMLGQNNSNNIISVSYYEENRHVQR